MKSKYIPGIRVNGLVEDAILGQDVVEGDPDQSETVAEMDRV